MSILTKTRVVPVCFHCRGSGLEPTAYINQELLARQHKKYVVCKQCKGEGK